MRPDQGFERSDIVERCEPRSVQKGKFLSVRPGKCPKPLLRSVSERNSSGRRRPRMSALGPFFHYQRTPVRSSARVARRRSKAPSMASPFEPHSSQTAKEATGSEWAGRCARLRAHTQATSSSWRSRRRERNWNPRYRQICGRLLRPPRRHEHCGRTSRPSRAEIGYTGSPRPSVQKLARVGSTMPARCSLPGSDAFAASIGLGSIVKISVLLKRRLDEYKFVDPPVLRVAVDLTAAV